MLRQEDVNHFLAELLVDVAESGKFDVGNELGDHQGTVAAQDFSNPAQTFSHDSELPDLVPQLS